MKKVRIAFTDIKATVHNERERQLMNVINMEIGNAYEWWITDERFKERFEKNNIKDRYFQTLGGELSALYHLGMIDNPLSSVEVFDEIEEAVKAHERGNTYIEATKNIVARDLGIDEGSEEWYQLMAL